METVVISNLGSSYTKQSRKCSPTKVRLNDDMIALLFVYFTIYMVLDKIGTYPEREEVIS